MTIPKINRTALAVTCLIYLLLAAMLLFFGLERTIPPEQEEGLLVNFGTTDASSGLLEPTEQQTPDQASTISPEPSAEELLTQDIEPSVNLEKKKKEDDRKKIQAEQERKASEIRLRTANVFARSTGESSNEGNASFGTGNQGNPNGDPNAPHSAGSGYGNFSLDGRKVDGMLPKPSYTIQDEGTVVVKIVVNPKGTVISATVNLQGTTTDNPALRSAALNAAKLARFNNISGTQNQTGSITYRFRLR